MRRMMGRLLFCCLLTLSALYLALSATSGVARAADVRSTPSPLRDSCAGVSYQVSATATSEWTPLFSTPTPNSNGYGCPSGNPLGYGTVTPESGWFVNCAHCLNRWATPTPSATATGTITGGVPVDVGEGLVPPPADVVELLDSPFSFAEMVVDDDAVCTYGGHDYPPVGGCLASSFVSPFSLEVGRGHSAGSSQPCDPGYQCGGYNDGVSLHYDFASTRVFTQPFTMHVRGYNSVANRLPAFQTRGHWDVQWISYTEWTYPTSGFDVYLKFNVNSEMRGFDFGCSLSYVPAGHSCGFEVSFVDYTPECGVEASALSLVPWDDVDGERVYYWNSPPESVTDTINMLVLTGTFKMLGASNGQGGGWSYYDGAWGSSVSVASGYYSVSHTALEDTAFQVCEMSGGGIRQGSVITGTPTPTPTPVPSVCSVVNGGGSVTPTLGGGVLPVPVVGGKTCLQIGPYVIGFDAVNALTGWNIATWEMEGINICFQSIMFGDLDVFGLKVSLDLITLAMGAFALIRHYWSA